MPGERVLYLAESPEHAIGEKIGRYRGTALRPSHLREYGLPLALVPVGIEAATRAALVDLCDPRVLRARGIAPDHVAARERETTQGIAARLAESGAPGLRWWSSYFGEWHALVLFADRLEPGALEFGAPRVVQAGDPALVAALTALGMRWAG